MTGVTAWLERNAAPWLLAVTCGLAVPGAPALAAAQGQPPAAAQQDKFEPLASLPPDEGLPAAPLVMAAYGAAWLVIVLYLWSIWRRLARVEREMTEAARRVESSAAQDRPIAASAAAPKPPGSGGGGG